jgi:osmoprotectant transport system substrate-binding protein
MKSAISSTRIRNTSRNTSSRTFTKWVSIGLICASSLGLAGAQKGPLTIGSKIDTEGALLCQMTKLLLEGNFFTIKDRCSTGTTPIVRKALLEGEIDLYPEYTGNVVYFFPEAKVSVEIAKNPAKIYATAKSLDAKNKIVWLKPAPANNTWAIAIPLKLSQSENLKSFSDLAKYLKAGKTFKLAASQEFADRDDALKGFEKAYGFTLTPEQLVILPGGNTTQTETAAAQGTSGVNAAMAYGTDGTISALGLVALNDPKGGVAVYQPAMTVRQVVYSKYPELAKLINPVFATLTKEVLSELNGKIAIGGENASKVAGDYLRAKGFLK